MIGQKNNIQTVIRWRCNKSVPRFIIIVGDKGSGRLTLTKVILKMLGITGVISECGIDAIRNVIECAYTLSSSTMYIFRDADNMSIAAKNALLKVIEEPPNNAYFVMTVQNIDGVLSTIKSRGTILKIEPYLREDLKSYKDDAYLLNYCSNIGQMQMDITDLKKAEDCVNDIIVALQQQSGTKLLKACTQLKSKQSEIDKIDGLLFMRIFEKKLLSSSTICTCTSLIHISKCKQEISRNTVNKKASIECMLINLLEDLKYEE